MTQVLPMTQILPMTQVLPDEAEFPAYQANM